MGITIAISIRGNKFNFCSFAWIAAILGIIYHVVFIYCLFQPFIIYLFLPLAEFIS